MSPLAEAAPPQKTDERAEVDAHRMSFLEHLAELRKRLRNAFLAFLVGIGVATYFADDLFDFLTRPLRTAWIQAGLGPTPVFNFASPTEPFWVYMKLALVGALLVSSPFIFWELWKFIAPGLYRKERRMVMVVSLATGVCFSVGALFGYRVLCPPAARYLLSFAHAFPGVMPFKIQAVVMMDEVFGFLVMLLAGCGIAFELPVILGLLGWLGLVNARSLWRFNRFAIILSAVVGGILTPGPDVLSQVLMAAPLFGLYNASILVVWAVQRSRRAAAASAPAQA